jgi:peptidoglycan/xylan/chitin deacetylase (PgdA/CDA1 family)
VVSLRRSWFATIGLAALVLTACVAGPAGATHTTAPAAETAPPERPGVELRTLDRVDIPELHTVTDGDNGSLVYAVLPQISGYDILNDQVKAIAAEARQRSTGTHRGHRPPRGLVNVSWQALGSGEDIVGFLLSSLVGPGAGATVGERSVWYDAKAERLLTWRDLVAGPAQEGVIEDVLTELRRDVVFADTERARTILQSGDPVVGFSARGDLVLGFGEDETAAGSATTRFEVAVPDGELTPVGVRAREAALAPRPLAPAPAPAPPSSPEPPRVDCRKDACVAITFDDGPAAGTTSRLLDVLAHAKAPATFFVLGTQAQAYPRVLARIVADGHEIGNHSWSHPDLTRLDARAVRKQILRTERAIEKATGVTPTVLRPPYGARDKKVDALARTLGYAEVLWSIDTRDWANHSPKKIVAAAAKARRGSIILMHDIHPETVDAVPRVIAKLRKKGFTLVTVSELLGASKPGKRYYGTY